MLPTGADPHLGTTLLVVFDLAGTFVFALSGATKAVEHRLDVFGVLVLCFAAGNSGGIARDVMIGAVPPRRSASGDTSPFPSSRARSRFSGIR